MKAIAQNVKDKLSVFLEEYLKIFNQKPVFDISVFYTKNAKKMSDIQTLSSIYPSMSARQTNIAMSRAYASEEINHGYRAEWHYINHCFSGANLKIQRNKLEEALYTIRLTEAIANHLARSKNVTITLPISTAKNYLYVPVLTVEKKWLRQNANYTTTDAEWPPQSFFDYCMYALHNYLEQQTIPADDRFYLESDIETIYSNAANNFLNSIFNHFGLYRDLNVISSLGYEKKDCKAQIAFSSTPFDVPYMVKFKTHNAVNFTMHRKVRKLLELTGSDKCLFYDNAMFSGICDLKMLSRINEPRIMYINIKGHASWEISTNKHSIVRYNDGRLRADKNKINVDTVKSYLFDQFGCDADIDSILTLIQNAHKSGHGTILVFSSEAAAEAERFKNDSLGVEPFSLNDKDISDLTSIDGAMLIDLHGTCFALGVILDGNVDHQNDNASRGARFNSAQRYYKHRQEKKIVVVVVSDDGMIDFCPKLDPFC